MLLPLRASAVPPQPSAGTAVVDGHYEEWNLTADFFADMYQAGKTDKPLESKLYLRYDCASGTMYALVLVQPGIAGYIDPSAIDAWIAIDAINHKVLNQLVGNDGIPPDFAWVGPGFDGTSSHVLGYEASFRISHGTHFIIAHIDVLDGGQQTSATDNGFPHTGPDLVIPDCSPAVEPVTFGALKALYR